ncbi:NAD(P)/FAD-dependent oxidoreductase [Sinomonas sp. ASV322]|uniref:NAD(P)/FAD-dependent oxidoreductase n=1 Tax=Sinomonas sp. ASV322 TaxID=3041920 RepID=UPI0027DCD1CC|nr:NAD(P)/FAD-dependent oxidoreductase [Sinomonas sp. ASV322]MDQ4501449.1 NAD(P)/FAD-dependent oxidoreductase [Sinomonas sp. ASV322]
MSGIAARDVAVVGAGPAGLAAAVAAVEAGARVVVVDSAAQPGGQYWRHRPENVVAADGRGHHDWGVYLDLRARFDAARATGAIEYVPGRQVWMAQNDDGGFTLRTTPTVAPSVAPSASVAPPASVAPSDPAGAHPADVTAQRESVSTIRARRLVLCPGAYDRQLPVPGWDLPGVMAAGGIQAFIKANGALPGRRFVVAGTGPFLLPVAANIAEAGGMVAAVLESSSPVAWFPHLGAAAGVPEKALEGLGYAAVFARHRIPYRTRTVVTEVLGEDRTRAVRTARVDPGGRVVRGSERLLEDVDVVGFGWGFTPQLELPVSLGAETRVDADRSLVAVVDTRQESSIPGLFLAGEVTGVGGAALAVLEGRVAGASAAARASALSPAHASPQDRDQGEAPPSDALPPALSPADAARVARYRRFAQAMHRAHPVPDAWHEWLTPETTVCRCEEVTAGQIAEARDALGAADARSLKSFTRAGMGWCQGRVCGFAASCLGAGGGAHPSEASLAASAKRPLAAPVSIGELAALEPSTTTKGTPA